MDRQQNNEIDLNQRIAILGAGAAGLTAAEALKQKGYQHITVFERTDHAGGKCLSVDIAAKTYELGAGILTENNTVPLRLAKKYAIPFERAHFGQSIFVDQNGQPIPSQSLALKLKVLWQLFFRYRRILKRYNELASPGFRNLSPAITLPFDQFSKKYKISDLANVFSLFLSGFGYCYSDHVPTAYVLKYVNWKTIVAYLKNQVYTFPNGIQGLWTRVARQHDVRFKAEISQISRAETITIDTESGREEFDKLIVTTPLDETALFMDLSLQEQTLFKKIQYLDYQTILCTVNNFVEKTGYVPENFCREREGHPVFWYYRHAGQPVYSFYVLTDKNISEKEVTDNLRTFVHQMGGEIESVHQFIHWKYFPHVETDELNKGFYDKLNQLQGNQHTFYAGEILNFSCVGFTSEYAEYIVNQHF
ncbi:FAD-dependent oxidoreductase (plasmid) [Photobacterium sp. DA100]|uniref:FAD-dependent oxidoreductase n=1 Tax=Photobacterium sp. DA100 TaxID=3027472 RepID=UPI002479967A|nr:FAD-dependent oxidoreductase [Photobacterium sp. DA100]WEM44486.1 FAD-dependent oxidoreductase [Photobacterium sp. DA100]